MKKVLLGSTALVALGLVPAMANAADKIELGLSGYFNAYLTAGSVDDNPGDIGAAGVREHGIGRESEIHFRGQTTLDNGIKVGVRVELEGETSADQIDNSYVYFDGGFGRVEVGSIWGPGLIMFYGSPGHVISGHGRFASQNQTPLGPAGFNNHYGYNVIDNVNDKIVYYSPRFAGFQIGLGYTPDDKSAVGADETGAGFNTDTDSGSVSEVVVVGVNYVNKFGGVDVALYGSYGEGDVESTAATAAALNGIDPSTWALGATFGYMGFQVGGNYMRNNENFGVGTITGAGIDRTEWELGASYSTGPWTFGLAYMNMETDGITGFSDDEHDYYSLGVRYAIGPGVTLIGGVQHHDIDASRNAAGVLRGAAAGGSFLPAAADGQATVFLLGTALSF
jgi:predicted porin